MRTIEDTTSFAQRVQTVRAGFTASGVMDRFAANDVLLDLLEAAEGEDDQARVLAALSQLPKSSLVDRALLASLLADLTPSAN